MTQTGTIRTDGATLYYERRGSGPALLMISGGGGDAGYYSVVGDLLADAYTVLTYDRRGNSRSTADRAEPLRMEEQSADALAILAHHDLSSAQVFGGSGGALIGLDLTVRAPAAVEGLIAHEPPVLSLLSTVEHELFAEIAEITRREGPWSAFVRFIATIDRPAIPALVRNPVGRRVLGALMHAAQRVFAYGPQSLREASRFMGNADQLMTREVQPFVAFEPDYAALKSSGIPIVIGVGAMSRPYYPARAGEAVAARLGVPVVEFPGPHAGYTDKPAEFAVVLRKVLGELATEHA